MAYAFAFLVSFGYDSLFLPAFILGYWLSNILGFILMHYGYVNIKESSYSFKEHWKSYLVATTVYLLAIFSLRSNLAQKLFESCLLAQNTSKLKQSLGFV